VAVRAGNEQKRFLSTKGAAEYSGIPANTLRAWRSQGGGPKYYKPRGRALYDIDDLDEFIRSGFPCFLCARKQGGTECLSFSGVKSGITSFT
jgi:hypothetical protein